MLSIIFDFSYFIEALDAIEEGDGTLLDNSLILCTSDVSYGRTHQIDEFYHFGWKCRRTYSKHTLPFLQRKCHLIPFGCMQALDIVTGSFGTGEGEVNQGLSAIKV